MPDAAFDALLSHLRETDAIGDAADILSWDQEVMMPPKGAEARAESAAAMAGVLHARRTDPRIPEWLAALDRSALDPVAARDVALTERDYARAARIPAALEARLAALSVRGQTAWTAARAADDFDGFAPVLAEMVAVLQDYAAALAEPGQDPYDALLEEYEPGLSAEAVEALFAELRAGLTPLAAEAAAQGAPAPLTGHFPAEAQLALAREMATVFGYDWDAGRMDLATHPFAAGGQGDARITTRVDEADPFNCLYSTIHETGHAVYEQNIAPVLFRRPTGNAVSLGVHESQSRLFENQIGRSRAFCEWLAPVARRHLGDAMPESGAALFRAANRIHPDFIRTEADEVHYNLHIMMRFDLERALLSGALAATDLEEAWNARFAADFGRTPPGPAQGCLQDVHWASGGIGYFPTYTLGNLNAAALDAAMRRDLPDLDDRMARGELEGAVAWLNAKVHAKGSTLTATELMERATGGPLSAGPLLAHLRAKVDALA